MPTSIRLNPETEARLNELAATTGRSKAYYLRELIETGLDQLVWQYTVAQRASDIRAGRRETIAADDVRRELDLDS